MYSVANMQAVIFLQPLEYAVEIPGDWYMGLNMLTSIYSIYYHGFLNQSEDLPGWKGLNKDARSCYFQSSRLVTFVHDELMRSSVHQFIANR